MAWVADCEGVLSRYWLPSGKRQWAWRAPRGIHSGPRLISGRIVFGCDDGSLFAVDAVSGQPAWRVRTKRPIYATPVELEGAPAPTLLAATLDGRLLALDPATGAQRWSFVPRSPIASEPRRLGDHLYLATMNGTVHQIGLDGTAIANLELGDKLYAMSAITPDGRAFLVGYGGGVYCLDLARMERLWTAKTGPMPVCMPVWDDERVYVSCWDRHLYAFDRATGEPRWSLAGAMRFYNSPLLHAGKLYAGNDDGTLYCLEPQRGWIHWTYKLTGPVRTEMRVVDDRWLITGTMNGHLYVLGLPDPTLLGAPTPPPARVASADPPPAEAPHDPTEAPPAEAPHDPTEAPPDKAE